MDSEEIEELVEELEAAYGHDDIPEDDLSLLKEMIISLDNFHIDVEDLSDDDLKEIIDHWVEYRANL